MLGVFNLKMARLYFYMYQQTDVDYSIVHSLDGFDEISLTGDFKVINKYGEYIYSPKDILLDPCMEEELSGGDTPQDAAKIFDDVLDNTATKAQKNAVIAKFLEFLFGEVKSDSVWEVVIAICSKPDHT